MKNSSSGLLVEARDQLDSCSGSVPQAEVLLMQIITKMSDIDVT